MTDAHKLPDEVRGAIDGLSVILMDLVTDPATARRVAELFECLDQPDEPRMSVGWWRRAADMGDADARDYLRELIDEGLADKRPHDSDE